MKNVRILAVAGVMATSLAGCMDPGGAPGTDLPGSGSPGNGSVVTGASMAGAMGNVESFASDSTEVRISGGDTVVQLDAVNTAAQWWVMSRLSFSRPLSDPSWAPGLERTFSNTTTASDGLRVSLVGCSGPSRGHYTFDRGPDRVQIHVLPSSTPDNKLVSFAAYWDSTNQVVTGTFAYAPN